MRCTTCVFVLLPSAFLAVVTGLSPAAPPATQIVASFESDAELKQWVPWKAKTRLTNAHVTHGKLALQVDFNAEDYPSVRVGPKTPLDFRNQDVALDVANPGKTPVTFSVRLDDDPKSDGGTHCRVFTGTIQPGKAASFVMPLNLDQKKLGMNGI